MLGCAERLASYCPTGNVGPAVFGLWRPTVILPTSLVEQTNTRSLAPIVLHELMHIRRGDLWLALHSTIGPSHLVVPSIGMVVGAARGVGVGAML